MFSIPTEFTVLKVHTNEVAALSQVGVLVKGKDGERGSSILEMFAEREVLVGHEWRCSTDSWKEGQEIKK